MNNEIKEILDRLKRLCYDDYCLEVSVDYIERKEEKLLLYYITNLQEENERLNNKIEKNRKFIIKLVNDIIIPMYDEEKLKKYMNIDNKYVMDSILKYYDSYGNDEYLHELKGDSSNE